MTGDLYIPGDSPLHRLAPGWKLGALAAAGTSLALVGDWRALAGALGVVLLLYPFAGLSLVLAWRQLRPVAAVLVVLFTAQLLLSGLETALAGLARLAALVLLAALVTLTTRASAMLAAFERGLGFLAVFGASPRKAGLALSLTLRFIPVIGRLAGEVREAQAARGLERSLVALAVPLLVRTLKMADEVAEAIEARGFDPEPPRAGTGQGKGAP